MSPKIPSWFFVGLVSLFVHLFIGFKNSLGQPFKIGIEKAMYASTMPLWRNKNYVPNIDTSFFCLDDDNNNKISLIHHGLYNINDI